MNERLRQAVDASYIAFERARPALIDGCPCCVDKVNRCVLTSTPLRELTCSDLDSYSWKAMTTIGSREDFRYFWPRILELTIDDGLLTNVEIVFGKLAYGDWQSWPESERAALLQLADALAARFADDVLYDPDDWLCALGSFVPDIRPYLGALLQPTPAAGANLTEIYATNERTLTYGALSNGFWSEAPHNRDAVLEWLQSDEVLEALTA